ncbi:MAG: hypothetical protein IKU84_07795 [Clostridia bacterium]|nr:hypothetical protein [Clostridia bacterium]
MEIKEYLENPKQDPITYDFTNDCTCEKYKEKTDVLERYIIYTCAFKQDSDFYTKAGKVIYNEAKKYAADVREKYIGIIDADSQSELLQKIYQMLWEVNIVSKYNGNCVNICGDTLNSVRTALKSIGYTSNLSIQTFITSANTLKSIKGLEEFLSVYHTIGNFMPIPKGCNKPRGEGATKDFWDLALKIIYEYYYLGINNIVKIVGKGKVKDYKEWLDKFGKEQEGWKNFIKRNYLEPFVESDYGKPIELWDGHFAQFEKLLEGKEKTKKAEESYVLPNKEQAEQYFENAHKKILERGGLMLAALVEKLNENKGE